MRTDRIVTSPHVLRAVMELRGRGATAVLSELEKLEPDLAEWVLEGNTQLYHQILDAGVSGKAGRRLRRQAEQIVLVGIMALRAGHADLWRDEHGLQEGESSSPPSAEPLG